MSNGPTRKKVKMRTITIIEHVSLDGVIQGPGGPEEDREGGFKSGGWSVPFASEAAGEAINAAQGDRFDLLLGRKTYNIFASYWPLQQGPMADMLNRAAKYVATHAPESLKWGPVESLGTDIAAGISRIKAADGPNLIVWGSSELVPLLIEKGLADTVMLMVFPVMLGTGKRIFSDTAAARELALVSTKATSTGVLLNTYRYEGALRTGSY
jgi:dihydrofolate reductase